ncbi:MAG TPA: hypothetical protein PLG15_02500 [Candidatus Gastranaerophilaceae bacterium]|nr:hypothetical protein [Candidatus Gastranaerophilaceae bacterium]HPT41234.1 hypothetical protein [Candidatus Gastranaerophilaceae bacterium]
MTQFSQLKLLYNQFFRLSDEIKSMIVNDEFNEAISVVQRKDALIKAIIEAKKTLEIKEEEKSEMEALEKDLKEKELANINLLKDLQHEVAQQLGKTNKSLKLNSAYSAQNDENSGSMLDFSE